MRLVGILLFLLPVISMSQSTYKETVTFSDEGYYKSIVCQRDSLSSGYFIFFSSSDSLIDLSCTVTNSKGKSWQLKSDFYGIKTLANPGVFYSGMQGLHINQDFLYKKKIVHVKVEAKFFNPHLPFYAGLSWGDEFFDHFTYDLHLGSNKIKFHPVSKDLDFLKVDSVNDNYTIVIDEPNRDSLSFLPVAVYQGENPEIYLSKWYSSVIPNDGDLDFIIKEFESIYSTDSELEIVKNVFKYARQKIRYLSIEDGLQGIIPRSALSTCKNKFGDCKDKGVLINTLLQHYGVESYVAISSTRQHLYDIDFPSVSCANHVVALTVLDGDTIVLDGTDTYGQLGLASYQTLGRKLFVVNDTKPFYYSVEDGQNDSQLDLTISIPDFSQNVMGTFDLEITGHYSVFLRSISKKDILNISHLEKWLESEWPEVNCQDLTIEQIESNYLVKGNFTSDFKLLSFNDKRILDLAFIPKFKITKWNDSNLFPFEYHLKLELNTVESLTTSNSYVESQRNNKFVIDKTFSNTIDSDENEKLTTLTFTTK